MRSALARTDEVYDCSVAQAHDDAKGDRRGKILFEGPRVRRVFYEQDFAFYAALLTDAERLAAVGQTVAGLALHRALRVMQVDGAADAPQEVPRVPALLPADPADRRERGLRIDRHPGRPGIDDARAKTLPAPCLRGGAGGGAADRLRR